MKQISVRPTGWNQRYLRKKIRKLIRKLRRLMREV